MFHPNIHIQTVKLDRKFEMFKECHYLTKSKDLIMMHTPGHTSGHTSIGMLSNNHKMYLLGEDVAYFFLKTF